MRHFDPDDLPDWDPTPDLEDLPDVPEPDTGANPNHEDDPPPDDGEPEDCPACLGNHACDVHGPGPIMPNDRMRIDAAGNVTDAHGR